MNAVNLIPADSRKRRLTPSTSWPTLALIGCLLAVLAGAVVYVTASNKVKSRQAELAQVTASVESWRKVASSYQTYTETAQQRAQELDDIRQLAVGRYPWEQLLSQIAGLMPTDASLTSLQATTSGASSTAGAASSTPAAPAPTTGAATSPLPAVQMTGCASSQSTVAQTMVQLHRIEGVSAVTLASAVDNSASGSGSGTPSSSSASGGGCPFPVQFQMSLTFEAPKASAATPATGSGTGASSPGTTSPGSGSTPASASTNSTGVQAQ